jgi:hypothetical protein
LFYPAPECLKQHAEEVLDLIIRGPTMVNIMEGEEEEEDEGCVKVAMSEDDLPEGEGSETPVSVFMNIVLRLKSWYLAEKPVFPSKHCRGGICTSHIKKWKQT